MFAVLDMEPQINGHQLNISLYNIKLLNFFQKENTPLNREIYKLSIDIYDSIIRKVFLSKF